MTLLVNKIDLSVLNQTHN